MRDAKPIFADTMLSYARPEGPPDLRHLRPTANTSAVMIPLNFLFWLGMLFFGAGDAQYRPTPFFIYSLVIVGLLSLCLTVLLIVATVCVYRSNAWAVRLNRIYAWSQTVVCVVSMPLFFIASGADNLAAMIPGALGAIYPMTLFVSFRGE